MVLRQPLKSSILFGVDAVDVNMENNNRSPLVSIIVTSYNHAEYLEQRMNSLINQTYKNVEIIVVDDCSSDNSLTILNKYKSFSGTQIISLKENIGYASAGNLGVNMSKGEYIVFAECDDYCEAEFIEMLVSKMIKYPEIGVTFCVSNIVDSNGIIKDIDYNARDKEFKRYCSKDTIIPQKIIQKFFLNSCVIPNMSASMIRKSLFVQVGGLSSSFKMCADWDLWCRLANISVFYYLKSPLNYYRTHKTTARNTIGIEVQMSEIYSLLQNAYTSIKLSSIEKLKFRAHLASSWGGMIVRNPSEGIQSFTKVLGKSVQYDKLSLLYLVLWFTLRGFYYSIHKLVRESN